MTSRTPRTTKRGSRPRKTAAVTATATAAAAGTTTEIPRVSLPWLRAQPDAPIDIPDLTGSLRGYQRVGVSGIVCTPRMVLADDPGLGKTVTTLAALRWLREAGVVTRALIVTPRALLFQWVSEVEKWFPGAFKVSVVDGTKPHRAQLYERLDRVDGHPFWHIDLVLTTYALMRNDREALAKLRFDQVIFDEVSVLRNYQAEQTKAAMQVVATIPRRLAISATPMQNHLEEWHSVLSIIEPSILGSRERFLRRYCNTTQFPITIRGRRRFFTKITGYRSLDFFKEEIEQVVLRRTIEEVGAQMPDLTIVDRWVDLTPAQRARYTEVESGVLMSEGKMELLEAIQQVTRLSQIANDVRLVFPEEEGSSKLEELERLLTVELQGRSVVIFSKSLEFLRRSVQPMLARHGIAFGEIVGEGYTAAELEMTRQRFQGRELQVICMTTAGEMGLNLDAAAHLICCDMLVNEARMRQVYGRIRRASSTHKAAMVIRLLTRDTLEERTLELLGQRGALLDFMDSPSEYSLTQMADLMKLLNRKISLLDQGTA